MSKREVRLVIDASGSMHPHTAKTIESINQYLGQLAEDRSADYRVTMILFSQDDYGRHGVRKLCDGLSIHEVPRLNTGNYTPGGGTPLYDAVGDAITPTADGPVLVVIQTDGEENSSARFNYDTLMALKAAREEQGWTFVFLAAGVDRVTAERMAQSVGVSARNTMAFSRGAEKAAHNHLFGATQSYYASGNFAAGQASKEFFAKDQLNVGNGGVGGVGGVGTSEPISPTDKRVSKKIPLRGESDDAAS